MLIGHEAIQLALRAQLRTLAVCTTGTMALAATAASYTRTTGSFVDDGFAVGMEVTPVGFTTTTSSVITNVDALEITVTDTAMEVDASASGRSLTVGLPIRRAWENIAFTPTQGRPWLEEQYVPGPESVENDGYTGRVVLRPIYSPRVYVPENTGVRAGARYADAIRRLFAPGTVLDVANGSLTVTTPPYLSQRALVDGWSCTPVNIPCEARSITSL